MNSLDAYTINPYDIPEINSDVGEFFENLDTPEGNRWRVEQMTLCFDQSKIYLPLNPSNRDITICAHIAFDLYRTHIVARACKDLGPNFDKWGIRGLKWKDYKILFQNYVWAEAKRNESRTLEMNKIIQRDYPGQSMSEWLHVAVFPTEKSYHFPRKGIDYQEWKKSVNF